MNIKYKKRIIGFLLLLGIALILVPLFFGRSVSVDELKLSAHIPTAPPKPKAIDMPIPPKEATVPAVALAKPPSADTAVSGASAVVFEQLSSPAATQSAAPTSPQTTKVVAQATPATVASTSTTTSSSSPATQSTTEQAPAAKPPAKAKQATTQKNTTKTTTTASNTTAWAIQVGSFSDKINAETTLRKLQSQGFTAYMHTTKTSSGDFIRVLVGPELRRSDAEQTLARLQQQLNMQGLIIKVGA